MRTFSRVSGDRLLTRAAPNGDRGEQSPAQAVGIAVRGVRDPGADARHAIGERLAAYPINPKSAGGNLLRFGNAAASPALSTPNQRASVAPY